VLWVLVVTEDTYQDVVDIPVKIFNIREGKTLQENIPETVQVKFIGNGKTLFSLHFSDVSLNLDLSTIKEYFDLPLKNYLNNVSIPRGLAVKPLEIVSPDTIKIRLDNVLQKVVPVVPLIHISPEEGYTTVDESEFMPDSILVEGPQKYISKLEYIFTDSVVFSKKKYSFTEKIKIKYPDDFPIKGKVDEVSVNIYIQKLGERILADIPIKIINTPENSDIIIIPSSLSLVVKGGVDRLAKITPDDINAYIDYKKEWRPERKDYAVVIETPKDISFLESKPKRFELITIKLEPQKKK
jgi:hypothetical protein